MHIQYSTDKKSGKRYPQRLIAIVYHIHIYTCALLVLVLVRMNRPKRGGSCYSWTVDKCVVAELSRERDISKSQLRARAWKDTTHRLVHCTFTTYQLWLDKGMKSFERRHPATNSLSLGLPLNRQRRQRLLLKDLVETMRYTLALTFLSLAQHARQLPSGLPGDGATAAAQLTFRPCDPEPLGYGPRPTWVTLTDLTIHGYMFID